MIDWMMLCRFFQEMLASLVPEDTRFLIPQHLSNILLAAATTQRRNFTPKFLNQALSTLLTRGNSQELSNTLWSLSALGLMRANVFTSVLERLTQVIDEQTTTYGRQILTVSFVSDVSPFLHHLA